MLVSDKLVIAHLPRTIWPIFSSFLIFYCYFTRLKVCEINWQDMRNLENIGHRKCAITNAYVSEFCLLVYWFRLQ